MEPIKILVSMDDLYDTRLSLLASISVHRAITCVQAGYGKRTSDHMVYEHAGLTEEQWRERYRKRPDLVLMRASRTKMYNLLVDLKRESNSAPWQDAQTSNFEVLVNEWPYRLSKPVQNEQIAVMHQLLGPDTKIRFVRTAKKRLTPKYLAEHCTHFIQYDFTDWMEMHKDTSEPGNLLKVTIIAAALLKDLPTPEDAKVFEPMIKEMGILELAEQFMAPAMNLRFEKVDYWCAPNR